MTELHEMDAHQLSAALNSQEVSCVEVAQHFLDRISSDSHGAFITVTADSALAQAAAVDATAITERPTFAGVPMAIKDLTPTAGVRTTMGSVIMAENVATQDAWVVELAQQAGFISLGKTNTPEFGLSSFTDNDLIGPAKAPADPSRNAGGSSGGAAAAVGAGLVPLALGSDGGGSIRIPASCCGVVGFKASRGRISPGPESPAWTGLATEGALTRTVRDAALMLDVLARPMPGDSRTWPKPPEPFTLALREDPEPLMIASWSKPYLDFAEASPESLAALAHARERLEALGHTIVEIDNPWPAALEPQFNVVWSAGMAAAPIPPEFRAMLRANTQYWIERGGQASAPELAAAMSFLELGTSAVLAGLREFDAFLTPTLALPPQPHEWFTESGDPAEDHRRELLFTPYTALMNMSGQPAVSLPLYESPATADRPALPIGVMLAAHVGDDALLLSLANQLMG